MMTKKREMAEWILDFFRRAKVDAGQIIMFRTVQNELLELNPKERDLFVPVANELMENGYFTYEEGTLQALRLTEKGREYIYNPSAELDCCHENQSLTLPQAQYLDNWHKSFVNYRNSLLSTIIGLETLPQATDEDRKCFELLKIILLGSDVQEIEKDLAAGNVKKSTIDKIAKLNQHLTDICLEHIQMSPLAREFWKQMAHLKIESDKNAELMRLNALRIRIREE